MSHAWMPLYVADYLGKTQRLSTAGHGAYMLLIMEYWQSRGLPGDDDEQMAAIVRLPVKDWQKLKPTIHRFFNADWTHDRIEEELARADDIVSKRSAAGRASAEARANTRSTHVAANGSTQSQQTGRPSPSPLPKEDSSLGLKNGKPVNVAPVIKARSAEKSNYLWLKATDTRRANAEAWWQANYGHRDLPWQSNARGQVCRVPWEAVRYPIPPPAEPERVPLSG